jgi:hypothetical protein
MGKATRLALVFELLGALPRHSGSCTKRPWSSAWQSLRIDGRQPRGPEPVQIYQAQSRIRQHHTEFHYG